MPCAHATPSRRVLARALCHQVRRLHTPPPNPPSACYYPSEKERGLCSWISRLLMPGGKKKEKKIETLYHHDARDVASKIEVLTLAAHLFQVAFMHKEPPGSQ